MTDSMIASFWVARKMGAIQSWHRTSVSAVRWMNDNADSINGWSVSQSYTTKVGYWNKRVKPNTAFAPEFAVETGTFPEACDALAKWLHIAWEQDRSNHPSPPGRQAAWERWHDVLALVNISSLTRDPAPSFTYRFGKLSPPEGRGHDLRIQIYPTTAAELDAIVMANRGCDA